MGMPVVGTVENIEGFTRDYLVRHVQAHYAAQKTVVVAAGNFDVDA
jgi:predicted Zn-dependent peptidase